MTASKQSQYAASSQNVATYTVSSSQLEDANITNTQDLNKVLPGVNIGHADTILFPLISIRGISSAQDFYNTAVTLYVDGVPQPSVSFIQPLGDIQSVELLKGPQGTLYGKTSQGGVINIVTKKPGNDYQGYLSGGYASRNGYRGKFAINGPLAEGLLYASVSGMREVQAGRITNPSNGHQNLGGQQDNAGSVKVRLAPDNQPWEISASYTAECMATSQGLAVSLAEVKNHQGKVFGNTPDPSLRRCLQNQVFGAKYSTDHWLFTAIGSWEQIHWSRDFPAPFPFPRPPLMVSQPEKWWQDVQEIRVTSQGAGNLFDMVLGLYRQNTRQKKNIILQDAQGSVLSSGQNDADTQMQSLAAYTDLTWHIHHNWDIGAGVRLSHDSASTRYIYNGDNQEKRGSVSRNTVSGQLSTGYQITPHYRLYARIAQGYKPSGFDYSPNFNSPDPRPYQPERSISYEIGNQYQTDAFMLQAAAFYTNTKNVQMYVPRVNNPQLADLANSGDSRAYGLELAADYHFIDNWTLGANANFTHARFLHNTNNRDYAGKRVPFVPNYSAGIHITGNIATPVGSITPWIGINWTGAYTFDDSLFSQTSYATADIRVGWQATERITLSAYVNNLFDRRYFTYAASAYDYGYSNIGRTAGLDVKIDLF